MTIVIFKHGKLHYHIFYKIISCLPIDRPDLDFWTFHQSLSQNAAVFRNEGVWKWQTPDNPMQQSFSVTILGHFSFRSKPSPLFFPLAWHFGHSNNTDPFLSYFLNFVLNTFGAFYSPVSCFGAFTTFSDCTHDCTRLICLERLCLLCCCCYCCQRVNNCPLGVLRLTAGVGLQLHSRHNAGLWHSGTAIPLRATRSADSRHRDWNSHLPVPSPPAGCQHIGESENAGQTLAGERTSTYIFKYSWSKTTIKRQLQTNWSKLQSLQCIALHCIGGRRDWATTSIFIISIVRQHLAVS